MKTLQEILEKNEKALAELEAKVKALKPKQDAIAYCVDIPSTAAPAISASDIAYLHQRIDWMRESVNDIREMFWQHQEGHIPKIVGATAMTKALKALGLDGDYDVAKKTIYANDGKATAEEFLLSRKL